MKRFCNYEHLGGCTDQLTHRADYWLGSARRRLGRHAYWCEHHALQATHLGLKPLPRPLPRSPKAEVLS